MVAITVLNQKGGVGKTSTTFHLAGALASLGRRVLMLDNDPQASLTQVLFGSIAAAEIDPSETMAAVYSGEAMPELAIRQSPFERIKVVAGSEAATLANVPDLDAAEDRAGVIRDFLDYARDDFDLALIDCPSNLQFCSFASLVASDWVVVPIVPEDLGTQGIVGVGRLIARVQAGPNPNLRLLGYLLSMTTKKAVHQVFEGSLRRDYGREILTSSVPNAAGFAEAIAFGQPVTIYKPKGIPAARMRDLAGEVLARTQPNDTPAEMVA